MPAYRFSWDAFDDRTVEELARLLGHEQGRDGVGARPYLAARVKRPTAEFVGEARRVFELVWLPQYAGLNAFVDRLTEEGLGPGSRPRSKDGRLSYVRATRNSARFRQFLLDALLSFGDADKVGPDEGVTDFVRRFTTLRPSEQPSDQRRPHSYQQEAWEKLGAHLAESEQTGMFRGLLVMPTGSGKTYTAVRWLVQNVVARGGRVLWLAHRTELLNQAAREFHKLVGLAEGQAMVRVRIVSGAHCGASQIDPGDHVVVASIGTLARRSDKVEELLADPQVFVVVDEAHHAPAEQYKTLLKQLVARKRFRLLGLTATPTRTQERERGVLSKLFGGRVLHQVELRSLVERKILARPRPVRVSTHVDVEQGLTIEDYAHMRTFSDLSEDWLDRIAHLEGRNRVIVDHYLDRRSTYGRTLVFAVNVAHAALLASRFRERGVRADYLATYRPDATDGAVDQILRRFRDGEIEVLVNVQMVTEGIDVPAIQTVFLARPTHSEILVRQMIGRALRGPAAGGTADAYLVSFEDHWSQFRDWASPLDLVPDVTVLAPPEPGPKTDPVESEIKSISQQLPWDLIVATANRIRERARGHSLAHQADAFEAVHHGWYVLERMEDEEAIRQIVPVYEHQRGCWEALLGSLKAVTQRDGDLVREVDANEIDAAYAEYFGDCDDPAPAKYDVGQVLTHVARGGALPQWNSYEERTKADPYEIARQVLEQDLGERAKSTLLDERYTPFVKSIYPTMREFRAAVEDALYEASHPEESTRVARCQPIFEPAPDQQMRPGPTHDLEALLAEVLVRAAAWVGHELPHAGPVIWTRRIVKGWYGKAYFTHDTPAGHGEIRINRLLDSPDFSAEGIRFLLWHEYVHLYLKAGHTNAFRELERKWPDWQTPDREMDNLNERFGVQYW